jgi:D-alanyl-D-alanine carboxypeptidase
LKRPAPIEHKVAAKPSSPGPKALLAAAKPRVQAKAMFCQDCSSDKVMLAENVSEPLPIASITKLLTAMIVLEEMKLDQVLPVPTDIDQVERHKVGLRPEDRLTVRDLLHGMLIASGNDCAEVLARAYPKGGKAGFMVAMNRRARQIGAARADLHTPSGLDMKITLGRKDGRDLEARRPNIASAKDVALIAREAFRHPLIRKIAALKTYTMQTRNATPRDYRLASNDKLLAKNLPVAGAKTGFTNAAGRCIVALFKDEKKEHVIVVLNSPQHFKAAEKIYRWASARTM